MSRCSLILAVALLAMVQPAYAICANARGIATIETPNTYSYIYSPGIGVFGGNPALGYAGTTLTSDVAGAFWRIGFGDPRFSHGADSGAWPPSGCLYYSSDCWLYHYPNYPVLINTTWAASGLIDGCAD